MFLSVCKAFFLFFGYFCVFKFNATFSARFKHSHYKQIPRLPQNLRVCKLNLKLDNVDETAGSPSSIYEYLRYTILRNSTNIRICMGKSVFSQNSKKITI